MSSAVDGINKRPHLNPPNSTNLHTLTNMRFFSLFNVRHHRISKKWRPFTMWPFDSRERNHLDYVGFVEIAFLRHAFIQECIHGAIRLPPRYNYWSIPVGLCIFVIPFIIQVVLL